MNFLKGIWSDESGQDLVEYALMAGFVAVAAAAIIPDVANSLRHVWVKVMTPGVMAPVAEITDGSNWIRIGCAVLAVLVLYLIVRRRVKSIE